MWRAQLLQLPIELGCHRLLRCQRRCDTKFSHERDALDHQLHLPQPDLVTAKKGVRLPVDLLDPEFRHLLKYLKFESAQLGVHHIAAEHLPYPLLQPFMLRLLV